MGLINLTRTNEAIEAGLSGAPQAGSDFRSALQNFAEYNLQARGAKAQGIHLVNAEGEAMPALVRAYESLEHKPSKSEFAAAVSDAIQSYVSQLPDMDKLPCYPHFLFHGLMLGSAHAITEKIRDNGRILIESDQCRNAYSDRYPHYPEKIEGYFFALRFGGYDDFSGLSMHLQSKAPQTSGVMAKIGFLIDPSNAHAYIINVQGRRVERKSSDAELLKQSKDAGRDFARLSTKLGMDVRAFALRETMDFLASTGIREVRAIRPSEHLMAIGSHSGFRGTYEPAFVQADMQQLDETYYIRHLTQNAA